MRYDGAGYIGGRLISADASATATSIMANESLYRLAFAIYLVEMACQIAMTVLFYELLKPAGRTASALATVIWLLVKGVDEQRWTEQASKENAR